MNILQIKMQRNDAKAKTIGGYLEALLTKLWDTGEGFSGKRPFGNSCWEHEIYTALVKAKAVEGKWDEECEELVDVDEGAANKLIFKAIKDAFSPRTHPPEVKALVEALEGVIEMYASACSDYEGMGDPEDTAGIKAARKALAPFKEIK